MSTVFLCGAGFYFLLGAFAAFAERWNSAAGLALLGVSMVCLAETWA